MKIPIGTALDGRYVLIHLLATGGVSTVYQAVDVPAGRHIAVKVVDDRFCVPIRHEAAMMAKLRHPHVPELFGADVTATPDGKEVGYLAMELLRGQALSVLLHAGPLSAGDALRIAGTAADVLAVAHRRGVVHRDLTAANVMLTVDGPKVVDFGLAEHISCSAPTRYAQPADDVYALGVLLCQMLTGRSPYARANRHGPRTTGALRCMAPAPVLAVSGLPAGVGDLCRSCMAKNPKVRPTAREVSLALWSHVRSSTT